MRHILFSNRTIAVLFITLLSVQLLRPVAATDGEPIMDLGIYSWLRYQQTTFFTDIEEIVIDGTVQRPDIEASIYQPIIFENKGTTNHRLAFIPGIGNKMEYPYTSPVIKPGERWGLEIHGFGEFEYQCTLHPEVKGKITVDL